MIALLWIASCAGPPATAPVPVERPVPPARGTGIAGTVTLLGAPVRDFGIVVGRSVRRVRDLRGRFVLTNLPVGTFDIAVVGDGFARRVLFHQAIEPDRITDLGELAVERGGTVTGRVIDLHAEPVAGIEVRLIDMTVARGAGNRTTRTDDRGRFAIEDVAWIEPIESGPLIVASTGDQTTGIHPIWRRDQTIDLVVYPTGRLEILGASCAATEVELRSVRLRSRWRVPGRRGTHRQLRRPAPRPPDAAGVLAGQVATVTP